MFTFLPEQYKKDAVREYHFRLAAVYLFLLCIFLLLGAALALPTFALIKAEKNALTEERTTLIKNLKENPEVLEKEVGVINEKTDLLTQSLASKSMLSVIDRILSQTTNGIFIQTFSLKRGGDNGSISLGGMASSRDALVAFSKKLQSEPSFSHTELPVGSFAKNRNIPFTISITSSF